MATTLFDLSESFVRKRGNFVPHGAVLTESGDLKLVGAGPASGADWTNSAEVLPILYAGLRSDAASLRAVAVAENVTITLPGKEPSEAIKVLIEHRRGIAVALYLPFRKKFFNRYGFGETFSKSAEPEMHPWRSVN